VTALADGALVLVIAAGVLLALLLGALAAGIVLRRRRLRISFELNGRDNGAEPGQHQP
jgi:hypothetical protein